MQKNIREIGGEIWSEITHRQNNPDENCLICDTDFRTTQQLVELVIGVLARHSGSVIINDDELPVIPLHVLDHQ